MSAVLKPVQTAGCRHTASDMTLARIVELADERSGSRKMTCDEFAISRQRLHSAIAGGPPLKFERLIRLGMYVDIDPSEALRAGGRAAVADLIEQAYAKRLEGTSTYQRALLQELGRFPEPVQQAALDFLRRIAPPQCDAASDFFQLVVSSPSAR